MPTTCTSSYVASAESLVERDRISSDQLIFSAIGFSKEYSVGRAAIKKILIKSGFRLKF